MFTLIHREAFERIGGFPEQFQGWGFEDTAFAIQASAKLKVLNLFRRAEPLLHIDHPVSPYKSAEYGENHRKFYEEYSAMDVDWLCNQVIEGADFDPQRSFSDEDASELIVEVVKAYQLPAVEKEVLSAYQFVIEQRTDKGQTASPEFVLLHGSRGRGTATATSDFDVLFLFRGGSLREFAVSGGEAGPAVEFEFTNLGRFESISQGAAFYPVAGPLELAKLAQAHVLWGDVVAFTDWKQAVLTQAMDVGRELWMAFGLGMSLQPEKYGVACDRFLDALAFVMQHIDRAGHAKDVESIQSGTEALGHRLRNVMDTCLPEWRADVHRGHRVFAVQGPEIWNALRWLIRE